MSDSDLIARAHHLLSLSRTVRHYEESLARAQGEHFNLFEILYVGHYEVRTHSPILAELLNPAGSHGQGGAFLARFLSLLEIRDFETEGAAVQTEVSIGALGRLDIVITDRRRERRIFIENKIYAGLQTRQLERYQEHDPKARILFLTLNGDAPSDTDIVAVPNLQLISYRTHILAWLDGCRKEAATAPAVREAITQYIHLIQRLTQQNPSARMNRELSRTILDSEQNLRAYYALRNAGQHIEDEIAAWVTTELGKVATSLGLKMISNKSLREQWSGFAFHHPLLEQGNITLNFEFDRAGFRDFCAGFAYIDHVKGSPAKDTLKIKLAEFRGGTAHQSQHWPAWFYWSEYQHWTDGETWSAIRYGQFVSDAESVLKRMLSIAQDTFYASSQVTDAKGPVIAKNT